MSTDDAPRSQSPPEQQFTIAQGNFEPWITQVGATSRSYTSDGRHLIDGFGIDERATDGRGKVLALWPNRITDGRYRYGNHKCGTPRVSGSAL